MKPDKKQSQQLIVLGALVLVCIGYMSFTVMSGDAPKPAPVKQARPEAGKSDKAAEGSGEVALEMLSEGVYPDLSVIPARRDPFVVEGSAMIEAQKTTPKVRTQPAPRIVSNPTGRVPRIAANPFNPFSKSGNGSSTVPQVQIEEQVPLFTLTGVIRGDSNVAIIRSEEGGRYVVKQGQLIDGRYKVESVSDDGATLVYKNRRIHVKLGGVKNAS